MAVIVKQYDELVKAVKNKERTIYAVESAYRKRRRSYKYYGEITGKPVIRNRICWMATGQEGAMIMNDYMDFRVRRIKKKLGDELESYTIQLNKEEKRIELTRKKSK